MERRPALVEGGGRHVGAAGMQAGGMDVWNHQRHPPFSTKQEMPRAASLPQPSPSLSLTPSPDPQSLLGASAFSRDTGGDEVRGSVSGVGTAEGPGSGGLSGPEGVSTELCFNAGVLLPPPSVKGSVPLYNPSQVPQLSTVTSLNRPNRLAQRRYPTQS